MGTKKVETLLPRTVWTGIGRPGIKFKEKNSVLDRDLNPGL